MELRHIRFFVALAEYRTFHRAAEALFVTQPHVSRQIKALEEELGAKLFHRGPREVTLTPAGEQFLLHARAVHTTLNLARLEVERVSHGSLGRLRIGVADDFVGGALAAAVCDLHDRYPRLLVETSIDLSDQLAHRVVRGEMDVALVVAPLPVEARLLRSLDIANTRLVALVNQKHRIGGKSGVYIRDLRHDAFVLAPGTNSVAFRSHVERLFNEAGFRPRVLHESNSSYLANAIAKRSHCVVIDTELSASNHGSELCMLPILDHAAQSVSLTIVWDEANPTLGALPIVELLSSALR